MEGEGPPLQALTRRLAETPLEFLAEPLRPKGLGRVDVAAVVSDLMEWLGGPRLQPEQAGAFRYPSEKKVAEHRNRLRLVLVGVWLLAAPELRAQAPPALAWLLNGLSALAQLVQADDLVNDPDRREEFSRLALQALNLRPLGESPAQAADRLTTMSSVERDRVIRQAREAELRAQKIRQELARKAAEEAAAAWGPE
ncbi:MAG: hypothetical protein AB1758_11630 [Candidatus Eremiobacterota bacterium]